jgi:hypothetical protein
MLNVAIEAKMVSPQPGYTTLMVWRDQAHFDEWANISENQSDDVRIVTIESKHLPMIPVAEGIDRSVVSIVGVAFGAAADFGDVMLKSFLVVTSK